MCCNRSSSKTLNKIYYFDFLQTELFASSKWLRSIESVLQARNETTKRVLKTRGFRREQCYREIFTKPSLDAFHPFGLISRACQGPRDPPNSINLDFENDLTQSTRLICRLLLNQVCFDVIAKRSSVDQN